MFDLTYRLSKLFKPEEIRERSELEVTYETLRTVARSLIHESQELTHILGYINRLREQDEQTSAQ